ncbi:MAG: peptidylprolyl isomerase [Bacillota bacterium]|nr:peptidylprolyl isomerase [Bacillota bacterium]
MRKKIFILMISTLLAMSLLVIGCAKKSGSGSGTSGGVKTSAEKQALTKPAKFPDLKGKKPVVTIEMEDGAKIKAELYPDIAPITVGNFVYLVQQGFYDGLIFHRVIPGFMIQGGDPTGTGMGGPNYTIKGEFVANNVKNDLKHERGVLSMARSKNPDSGASQFFIMTGTVSQLDGQYAAFGKVTEGMDEVDKIVNAETVVDPNSGQKERPNTPQVMKKVTVEIK